MRKQTEIYSIFGQIDGVVAEAMVQEGKRNRIAQHLIPATVLFDQEGRKAKFAIVVPPAYLGEFERRIRELAA